MTSQPIDREGEGRVIPREERAPSRGGSEATKAAEVIIVAFGGGTDSTAMLIEMVDRGERAPHAILFADTDGEHPHTYAHILAFSAWLAARGYPPITVVRVPNQTLEQMCLRLKVLPAIAYGWKTCSQRFKVEPQEKWANNDATCKAEWSAGRLVTRLIGYEYGEERRVRPADKKYINRYPLIEWKMDREACRETIRAAGLKLPGKSSCFFCPNMTKGEIRALVQTYPALADRAMAMEANAENLTHVKGLGRRFSWRDLIENRQTGPELPMDMPCECYDGAAEAEGFVAAEGQGRRAHSPKYAP